jgi:hypothetical protein
VTPHQIQLQIAQLIRLDAHVRKTSESRIDAINRSTLRDDLFNDAPRGVDPRARSRRRAIVSASFATETICASDSLWQSSSMKKNTGDGGQETGAGTTTKRGLNFKPLDELLR